MLWHVRSILRSEMLIIQRSHGGRGQNTLSSPTSEAEKWNPICCRYFQPFTPDAFSFAEFNAPRLSSERLYAVSCLVSDGRCTAHCRRCARCEIGRASCRGGVEGEGTVA